MMDSMGWRSWRNWPEQFEKKHAKSWSEAEILEQVRRLETVHWAAIAASAAAEILGALALIIGLAYRNPITGMAGCTTILIGCLITFNVMAANSSYLSAYHILWDIRKSEEEAVRRSEIEDL